MEVQNMSLEQKIGQMFICGFDGLQPTKEIETLITKYHIGGIIYFRRNISSVDQVHRLSGSLQQLAKKNSNVPLFISLDQEGGMVNRIDQGVTFFPGNMALGATGNPDIAYQAAYISGSELRVLGINMNLAPCLDINNNPDNPVIGVRSFGDEAKFVGNMGTAMVDGYQAANVSAVIKHFPGHGDTQVDSHLSLPEITHSLNRLKEIELVPFKQAIEHGVDAVMTAHIMFPSVEPDRKPSTLSNKIITGLLREELNFDGVVVTDCLEMNAISEEFGIDKGAVLAIDAGADVILVSHLFERQVMAYDAVLKAVQEGRISEERINESVERILKLKEKRYIGQIEKNFESVKSKIGIDSHQKIAQEMTQKCVTLVKDDTHQLPLDTSLKTLVIWPEERLTSPVDDVGKQEASLGEILKNSILSLVEYKIHSDPCKEEIHQLLERSSIFKQIVVVTYNAKSSPKQMELVKMLVERCEKMKTRLITVAIRTPYDIQAYPEVKTFLACYENRPMMIEALAKVLVGEEQAVGKCPVKL
ncbi:beta-N-acetylhexosaminidase [Chengkuizengella sediminis]|uniref:beta-N-acetylhexosaminidase n=1 Tax=Chengkuizengella sediminis TaxID=1885917 RepID=UPI00138A4A9F|nr:beta-N-acetylhexosaminidase [Chengkuizengella sediminis]NDI34187.1 beta-N-acetylhexosaminidase [Chengkuizengella sediminis]